MADKKITELTAASAISAGDVSVLVHGDIDYQYTFTLLLSFLQANLNVGAIILFQTATPGAGTGKNGDVVIKPSGEFWQKTAGAWILKYTIPTAASGNTIIYGTGVPNVATGINGDTFIRTDGGIFYKKISGSWIVQFTMATGPAGATGAAGANGTNGTNGNTVLHGDIPPSNLTDGVNGDFYINTSTNFFYGPKAGGVWPAGFSLIAPPVASYIFREAPIGLVNSSNAIFNLLHTPNDGTEQIFLNGLLQTLTTDYTIAGGVITFILAPVTGDIVRVNYLYGALEPNYVVRETPTGLVNSSNVTFTLSVIPISNTEQIFLNGSLQTFINDYTIFGATITMVTPPIVGDIIRVNYLKSTP